MVAIFNELLNEVKRIVEKFQCQEFLFDSEKNYMQFFAEKYEKYFDKVLHKKSSIKTIEHIYRDLCKVKQVDFLSEDTFLRRLKNLWKKRNIQFHILS